MVGNAESQSKDFPEFSTVGPSEGEEGTSGEPSPAYSSLFLVICLAITICAGMVGVSVPAIYDWTGADQSRPSPVVVPIAIGILIALIGFWIAIPFLKLFRGEPENNAKNQFGIRNILIGTTLVALACALPQQVSTWLASLLMVSATLYALWSAFRIPDSRLPIMTLFAAMYFPYLWVFMDSAIPLVVALGVLPGFFPMLFFGSFLEGHPADATWLGTLFSSTEMAFAVWVIRSGGHRAALTLAIIAAWLVLSVYGSFILNALTRV